MLAMTFIRLIHALSLRTLDFVGFATKKAGNILVEVAAIVNRLKKQLRGAGKDVREAFQDVSGGAGNPVFLRVLVVYYNCRPTLELDWS